jgi:KaiC/GvpD/RAD55 family RecA-like ATPase
MTDITRLILKKILSDDAYCRKVLPYIKEEYFESYDRIVYHLICKYLAKYNHAPKKTALEYDFAESKYNREACSNAVFEIINQIYNLSEDEKDISDDWMLENTEKWCKDRSIHIAIMDSIQIIDGKDEKRQRGSIPDILTKALAVSFDSNVGHDYIDNAEQRYEYYNRTEAKIPFDLEMFNKITRGGVGPGTLNVIQAPTGVGKTLIMCHFSSSLLSMGKNVLYISMEMAEEMISQRIDSNLFDIEINQIESLGKETFMNNINKIQNKTNGKLIVKQYPSTSAHSGHFRALLNELKLKKEFVPDAICIDYLNICGSSRVKLSSDLYSYVKSIAEELRGLSVEFNVPIWTATQTNRDGYQNTDVDLTNTSESYGLNSTADLIIAAISTEELESLNQIMFKQLKNRYNDPTPRRFVVGIDRAFMRLYDVEEEAQDDIMPEISEFTSEPKKSDFSDFNV